MPCKSACFESSRGHHYEETWPRSSSSYTRGPRTDIPGWKLQPTSTRRGEHFRKEPFEQLVNSYSKHLHTSPRHGSPQCMCYMNIHEHTWTALGCRPKSTCKADGLMPNRWLASPRVRNHIEVTIMKRLDHGHPHPELEIPGLTCPAGNCTRASTRGGEHSRKKPFDSLLIAIRNIYIRARDNIIKDLATKKREILAVFTKNRKQYVFI